MCKGECEGKKSTDVRLGLCNFYSPLSKIEVEEEFLGGARKDERIHVVCESISNALYCEACISASALDIKVTFYKMFLYRCKLKLDFTEND